MKDKFVDLPLTEDEAGTLCLHLRFVTRKDVADVLKEMKLTNDFDLSIIRTIADRLFDISSKQIMEGAFSGLNENAAKLKEVLARIEGSESH